MADGRIEVRVGKGRRSVSAGKMTPLAADSLLAIIEEHGLTVEHEDGTRTAVPSSGLEISAVYSEKNGTVSLELSYTTDD